MAGRPRGPALGDLLPGCRRSHNELRCQVPWRSHVVPAPGGAVACGGVSRSARTARAPSSDRGTPARALAAVASPAANGRDGGSRPAGRRPPGRRMNSPRGLSSWIRPCLRGRRTVPAGDGAPLPSGGRTSPAPRLPHSASSARRKLDAIVRPVGDGHVFDRERVERNVELGSGLRRRACGALDLVQPAPRGSDCGLIVLDAVKAVRPVGPRGPGSGAMTSSSAVSHVPDHPVALPTHAGRRSPGALEPSVGQPASAIRGDVDRRAAEGRLGRRRGPSAAVCGAARPRAAPGSECSRRGFGAAGVLRRTSGDALSLRPLLGLVDGRDRLRGARGGPGRCRRSRDGRPRTGRTT